MGFDLIGDVHGHVERLEALLLKLDYHQTGKTWYHPQRTVIFVGDLIDRGPGQIETLALVRNMMDAGNARAVMGNHEFNAIAWMTADPDKPGEYLRQRRGEKGKKNRDQHAKFLAAVGEERAEHRNWIEWFRTLPLWIEEEGFRVVHACWSEPHIQKLGTILNADNTLNESSIYKGARKGTEIYDEIETILKGVEVPLPHGHYFTDKEGIKRAEMRVRWWDASLDTYRSAYIGPPGVEMPDIPLHKTPQIAPSDRPTFFGHYWLEPEEDKSPVAPNFACLDYSVAAGGPLVAYRFDGEHNLSSDKYVWT